MLNLIIALLFAVSSVLSLLNYKLSKRKLDIAGCVTSLLAAIAFFVSFLGKM